MKRSEAVEEIKEALMHNYDGCDIETTASIVLFALEELGMLPPLSTVRVVPNESRPGTLMHTQAKHEWDEE